MLLFLYEWITGGGLLGHEGPLPESLLTEGLAMVKAAAADAARLPGAEVVLLGDLRVPQLGGDGVRVVTIDSRAAHNGAFEELCRRADHTLLIAPEIDGELNKVVRKAEQAGARLLSPGSGFTSIASDKHQSSRQLIKAGVAAVEGRLLEPDAWLPEDFSYPAVVKPNDGAGSQDVYVVSGPHDSPPAYVAARRIEPLVQGTSASVAVLCGPGGATPLPPCRQRLSTDGRLRYLGGSTPLAAGMAERAKRLALEAVSAMPPTRGYVGVDLVLGHDPDGSGDRVIEINPRLTTSYTGLRFAVEENLIGLMIAAARGETFAVTEKGRPLEFGVDGAVSYLDLDE